MPNRTRRASTLSIEDGPSSRETFDVNASDDFEAFAAGVLPKLLRLAYRAGATRPDAEDLAAEALARAYASWGRIRSLPFRDGWVLRTAANLACDQARRRARHRGMQDGGGLRPDGSLVGTSPGAVPGFEQGSAERMDLSRALCRLPRRQRQAVVLHHLAGLTVQETAAAMRASVDTVKKHLARALTRLHEQLVVLPEDQHDG
jgi:RNA polymerase sigma-70 factor (ECF subfamily)